MNINPVKRLAHSWFILFGIVVFSLGMIGGFLRSADDVAREFVYPTLTHVAGRVAGAAVGVAPGPVAVTVNDPARPITYQFDLSGPISPYNLLRTGARTSSLTFEVSETTDGRALLRSLNGVPAPTGKSWAVFRNQERVDDLNAPVLLPGDAVEFNLVR